MRSIGMAGLQHHISTPQLSRNSDDAVKLVTSKHALVLCQCPLGMVLSSPAHNPTDGYWS